MKKIDYLALDLGAESGRTILGQFDGQKLALQPIYRFQNGPVDIMGHLYWDVPRLWAEMKEGLAVYHREHKGELASIGLDTWGVDFGLLGRNDALLGLPFNYRDSRTAGMMDAAFKRVPRQEVFAQTGIQFMEINTLYQLLAMRLNDDPLLEQARTLLMIPDLFNYWFTGVKAVEFTIATTSQFYDPTRMVWAYPLLGKLGLPAHILPDVVQAGTVLGKLLPSVAEETGLFDVQLVVPACHDTGSAVAAVPALGDDFAYISSGTWSLRAALIPGGQRRLELVIGLFIVGAIVTGGPQVFCKTFYIMRNNRRVRRRQFGCIGMGMCGAHMVRADRNRVHTGNYRRTGRRTHASSRKAVRIQAALRGQAVQVGRTCYLITITAVERISVFEGNP